MEINAENELDFFQLQQIKSYKFFILKKENFLNKKFASNQKKFTLKYSLNRPEYFLTDTEKKLHLKFFKPRPKVKSKLIFSKHITKKIYNNLINKDKFDIYKIKLMINYFKFPHVRQTFSQKLFKSLFDINFLKKEKLYTKLKYSRVPQYDIVSGASAALLAGFLGFLVCEKFGFELLDSGDFYFLFMYIVFFCFFCRLVVKTLSSEFSA